MFSGTSMCSLGGIVVTPLPEVVLLIIVGFGGRTVAVGAVRSVDGDGSGAWVCDCGDGSIDAPALRVVIIGIAPVTEGAPLVEVDVDAILMDMVVICIGAVKNGEPSCPGRRVAADDFAASCAAMNAAVAADFTSWRAASDRADEEDEDSEDAAAAAAAAADVSGKRSFFDELVTEWRIELPVTRGGVELVPSWRRFGLELGFEIGLGLIREVELEVELG